MGIVVLAGRCGHTGRHSQAPATYRAGMRRWGAALAVTVAVATSATLAGPAPAVVHGDPAKAGEFPFVVSVLDAAELATGGGYRAQFCGGALTTPVTVVTAAHCALDPQTRTPIKASDIVVGLGRSLRAGELEVRTVTTVAIHPRFNVDRSRYDIAVLTLAEPVAGAVTVPVLDASDPAEAALAASGSSAQVAGWGNRAEDRSDYPESLVVGRVVVFPDASCGGGRPYEVRGTFFDGYRPRDADPTVMICAAGVNERGNIVDSCQGDSGSPLIVGTGDTRRLIGLVSWGQDCASPHPGVYTRLSAMRDFLEAAGAIVSAPPPAPPTPVVGILDGSLRVAFSPTAGTAAVSAYIATATAADGTSRQCATLPSRTIVPATCVIDGLANGVAHAVSAVAVNAAGSSPASAPVAVAPTVGPDPGRIVRAVGRQGIARIAATPAQVQRTLLCRARSGRSVVIEIPTGATAARARVPAGQYSCTLEIVDAGGTRISAPRLLTMR